MLQHEVVEGDELRRILTESGALPVPKVGPAGERAREEEELERREGA